MAVELVPDADSSAGRAVFRNRDFSLYVCARFLGSLGLRIQDVAMAWLVYDLTHDAFALGLIGLAVFLPTVPLSLVTGAIIDRFDRRLVLALSYSVSFTGSAAMIYIAHLGLVWPIYLIVVILGAARAFANPAGQALMATTIPPRQFSTAIAWSNSVNETANMVGPGIGGLLYPFGPSVPFAVVAACLGIAVVLVLNMQPHRAEGAARQPVSWEMILGGYRFIGSHSVILGAMTLDLVAVLLGGATALLPIFASEIFQTGPWGLGLLRSSTAAGSIVTALVIANFPLRRNVGVKMFAAVIVFGLATVGFGLSNHIVPAMLCLFVLGGADIVSVVIRQSLVQIETPDSMRGRVSAVHNILTGTANNLGDFESGTLASLVGAVPAVLFGGTCSILAALLWMRLFPVLRKRDRLAS